MSVCGSGVNDREVIVSRDCACGFSGTLDAIYDGCCRTIYWTCPECRAENEEPSD